jgi:RimJ/RimL family protein N-acetyltransferase
LDEAEFVADIHGELPGYVTLCAQPGTPALVPEDAMLPTAAPDLTLRELVPEDAARLHAVVQANQSHLTAHGDYASLVAASVDILAAELADRSQRRFGIFLGAELIGRADLIPVDPPRYGLGYWLARSATGHGYATQALAALLRIAANDLRATEIYAGVTYGNIRSERLLRRLGFAQVALFDTYSRFRLDLAGAEPDHTVFSQPPSTK